MNKNLLLQTMMECYPDGILLVSDRGDMITANQFARQLCKKMNTSTTSAASVPDPLWKMCQSLIRNASAWDDETVVLEDRIHLDEAQALRVRVRRFDQVATRGLMITLEDELLSVHHRVMSEQQRYGLTQREAEVWLLRQANCTYKAIAAQLHITVDTVKKHIKNINAKRQAFQ
ncbi:helix-turn-helix transcriptional regulator [Leptolyngbya sp. AN02str]|uniref:helix-turn-helix transcriptional regulator n=1 Tax=Leptolyngbya sp. AN02str TaxID=3423363 RepID=UPI003D320ADE